MLRKCMTLFVTVALVVCMSVASVGAVDASGTFDGAFRISNRTAFFSCNTSNPKGSKIFLALSIFAQLPVT